MTASPQRVAARRKKKQRAGPGAARKGEGTGTQIVSPELANMVIQGHAAHRRGDLDEAARLYEQALAARPDIADALHLLGVIHLQRHNAEKAVELIEAAIAADPAPPQFYSNYGAALHQAGRHEAALDVYRAGIKRRPVDIDMQIGHATLLRLRGRQQEAIDALAAAIKVTPGSARLHRLLGELHLSLKQFEETAFHYRAVLDLEPDNQVITNDLAYALGKLDRHGEAVEFLRAAIGRGAELADLHHNLGNSLRSLDRLEESEAALKEAVARKPERWQFRASLAALYGHRNRHDEAIAILEPLIAEYPEAQGPLYDLAACYVLTGRARHAIPLLERVLERTPEYADAWHVLGLAHNALRHEAEAEKCYRKAIDIEPGHFYAHENLSMVLKLRRDYDEANVMAHVVKSLPNYKPERFFHVLQVFQNTCDYEAIREFGEVLSLAEKVPPTSLGGAIFSLMVHAETAEEVRRVTALHRKWGMAVEDRAAAKPLPPIGRNASHKKLRVGILSSDLYLHSVGRHLAPLLRNADPERIEFYGYTAQEFPNDWMQKLLMTLMKGFRFLKTMSPREIAEQIRNDEIDVLFELNGHTSASKMEVIAYRAAPIQVEWLGYPFTTGLKDMDYFLLDERVRPTADDFLIEKPLIKPGTWVTLSEYGETPIEPTLPADRNGYITFGSLNNPYKFTAGTLEAWARVLKAVPNSRFIVIRGEADSRALAANIAREFKNHGVEPERLFFFNNHRQGVSYLDCYNQLDLTVDTFPVTGGTTTADAVWMGVPVVTRVGPSHHHRISYGILEPVGLAELCTTSADELVERSVALANSTEDLRFLRRNLRDSVKASPLWDRKAYAAQFTDTLWELGREHGLV